MKITKLMIAEMSAPKSRMVFGFPERICTPRPTLPPVRLCTNGLTISLVKALIRALNARAMTRPTATTITSPRIRKFLKPLMSCSPIRGIYPVGCYVLAPQPHALPESPSRSRACGSLAHKPYDDSGKSARRQAFLLFRTHSCRCGSATEGPVEHPGRVGSVDRGADARAAEVDPDERAAVPDDLEEQAMARGRGVAGFDADRALVHAEQRVQVHPAVGVMAGAGGEPVGAQVHHRAEDGRGHRHPAELEQVGRGGVGRVPGRVGQPVEVAEVRAGHAEQPGRGVHLGDERG